MAMVAKTSAVMQMPSRVIPCGAHSTAAQISPAMPRFLRHTGGAAPAINNLSFCGVLRESNAGLLTKSSSSALSIGRRHPKRRGTSSGAGIVEASGAEAPASQAQGLQVTVNKTRGIAGQQTGELGLRKRVKVFKETSYLANYIQSYFYSLPPEDVKGSTLLLGGDGRHFNKDAAQIILKIAAGNGVAKMLVARNGFLSTPAASAVIRRRKINGGFIMTSSHDMGGPNQIWGVKFNHRNGQPAPESITEKIYKHTLTITEIKTANLPDVNYANLGTFNYGGFVVEVFDPVADYLDLLKGVFDFQLLQSLLRRPDFRFRFDCMYGVTAAYARPIFVDALGAPESSIANGKPLEDFGGLRPDPNLINSAQLAKAMNSPSAPDLGAACDGDGDRVMVLGKQFYVCPSDSLAIIVANAQTAIPYFRNGLKGVARSVFTSGALDLVSNKLQVPLFEVPSGWKHFGNLMDAGKLSICGEECFEIGADHIREKDAIWAVLAWLSILAHKNRSKSPGEKLVSVADVTKEHWSVYGRNYYTRHDYEDCETRVANAVLENTRIFMGKCKPGDKFGDFTLKYAEDFKYTDPVDKSIATKQGVRYIFEENCRIMFGITPGAGSLGPTLRLYAERYESDLSRLQLDTQPVLRPLMEIALRICQLKEYLRREKPNIIS